MAGLEVHACGSQAFSSQCSRLQNILKPVSRVWEGFRENIRCPRDTYQESYITKYTSVYKDNLGKRQGVTRGVSPLLALRFTSAPACQTPYYFSLQNRNTKTAEARFWLGFEPFEESKSRNPYVLFASRSAADSNGILVPFPREALRGCIPGSFLEPLVRCWSHFVGIYRQKLTRSLKH